MSPFLLHHTTTQIKFDNFHKDAEAADAYCLFLRKLSAFSKGPQRGWHQQGFVRAFVMFFKNKEIDQNRFFEQMDKYPFSVSLKPSKQGFLEMLYETYNYRRHYRIEVNSLGTQG